MVGLFVVLALAPVVAGVSVATGRDAWALAAFALPAIWLLVFFRKGTPENIRRQLPPATDPAAPRSIREPISDALLKQAWAENHLHGALSLRGYLSLGYVTLGSTLSGVAIFIMIDDGAFALASVATVLGLVLIWDSGRRVWRFYAQINGRTTPKGRLRWPPASIAERRFLLALAFLGACVTATITLLAVRSDAPLQATVAAGIYASVPATLATFRSRGPLHPS